MPQYLWQPTKYIRLPDLRSSVSGKTNDTFSTTQWTFPFESV